MVTYVHCEGFTLNNITQVYLATRGSQITISCKQQMFVLTSANLCDLESLHISSVCEAQDDTLSECDKVCMETCNFVSAFLM